MCSEVWPTKELHGNKESNENRARRASTVTIAEGTGYGLPALWACQETAGMGALSEDPVLQANSKAKN